MLRTDLQHQMFPVAGSPPVRWRIADGLVPYDEAVATMEAEVAAIAEGQAPELVWLVEHPPYIRQAPAPIRPISSNPIVSRSSPPGAVVNIPITAPASALPTSCWI